jgi:predicted nucleotidyltransferase
VADERPSFRAALEVLARHRVDFIIVGGVAAVLNGAPISTFDLDIVHARNDANIDRLMNALTELHAVYRDQTNRQLPPDTALLAGDGHHLFRTRLGPVDVLGKIGAGRAYEELIADSVELPLGDFSVRILDLAALIRVKEETAREKDLAVLAILRRTLAERNTPE